MECLLASLSCAAVRCLGTVIQLMASSVFGSGEDLHGVSLIDPVDVYIYMIAPTFPQDGYWQACTRFPFLALLMRRVVGV